MVDPDAPFVRSATTTLCESNLDVVALESGEEAKKNVVNLEPAIVLTEVDLPGINGFDLCRDLKANRITSETPIVFVTERNEEVDRVVGFELGATDYVVKPVNLRELTLRVLRILQRLRGYHRGNTMRIGRLVLDFEQAIAHRNGKRLDLSPTEFQILAALARAQGRVLTRDEIITRAWRDQSPVMARTVDAHIKSLRRKLDRTGFKLATIRGTGYCLRYHAPDTNTNTNRKDAAPGGTRMKTAAYGQESDREISGT